jgi:hypothetical protein
VTGQFALVGAGKDKIEFVGGGVDVELQVAAGVAQFLLCDVVDLGVARRRVELVMGSLVESAGPDSVN